VSEGEKGIVEELELEGEESVADLEGESENEADFLEGKDYEELDEESLDEVVEAEIAETAEDQAERELPEWAENKTVELYGREFVIEPPDVGVTLRIVKVLSFVALRGERTASRLVTAGKGGDLSSRAVLMGILAGLQVGDLYDLGAALLQFESLKEGKAWLKKAPEGEQLRLSPLVRAFMLNLSQSTDLQEALGDFFDGLGLLDGLIEGLPGMQP
jgi:hypothetical protein